MLAIVESRADRASSHICSHLLEIADWEQLEDDTRPDEEGGGTYYRLEGVELRSFETRHLDLERPADAFSREPNLLVFASRHAGNTDRLLTAHCTGNFGPAEYGGDDHAVAAACPNALESILEAFDRHAPESYDTGLECTHHGPTDVGCPSLFAEVGSSADQWDDPDAARAVARAILDLRGRAAHGPRQLVGFGGNHYVPRFERITRETAWNVGHVAADWALEELGDPRSYRDVIEAAFRESRADHAVLDGEWEGREVLERVLDDMGYRVVSETWVRTVGDRPRSLVECVESRLGAVDDGVRFGAVRTPQLAVVELPNDVLDTAEGIDPDAVWNLIAARTVGFETRNGGSRVGRRVALPDDGDGGSDAATQIVSGLIDILGQRYETVVHEGDAIVGTETAFDPALALEAGVPEGPAFGRLAGGQSVTVDGEEITPEDVCEKRTTRYELDTPFTRE